MKLIDLSHTIYDGLISYKGLPAPIICDFFSRKDAHKHYAEGTEFQIGKIEMVANTGTYIDVPFHRYENGKDFSEIGLEAYAQISGVVVKIPTTVKRIDASYFENIPIQNKAVLIHTGWSKHWDTPAYFENHPFLTKDAAIFLKENGAKLVGIDSLNIDDTKDGERPVHTILLGGEILIVEHLCNLEAIADRVFSFSAVPPKVKGMGSFPVRAYAIISD